MNILAPQRITLEFRFPVQLGMVIGNAMAELDSDHEFLAQHDLEGFRSTGIVQAIPEESDPIRAIKTYEFIASHSEEKNERLKSEILNRLESELDPFQEDIKITWRSSPA